MQAEQAFSWGLVDELADSGQAVEKALEMAEVVLSMPQPTVRMIKEAVNATANPYMERALLLMLIRVN